MGLFSKKAELQKDFFISCLDMAKNEVCDFRKRQGFKVELSSDYKSTIVTAKMGGYIKFIKVTNIFNNDGEKECSFFFSGFERSELKNFLNNNFPNNAKGRYYLISIGPPRTIRGLDENAKILPSGEVLTLQDGTPYLIYIVIPKEKHFMR